MHNIKIAFELHTGGKRRKCPALFHGKIEREVLGGLQKSNLFGLIIELHLPFGGGHHE